MQDQKRVKKVIFLLKKRNTFHLKSLILLSDKAENASQTTYNPLASGGLKRPPDPRPQWPCAYAARTVRLWRTGLDTLLAQQGPFGHPVFKNWLSPCCRHTKIVDMAICCVIELRDKFAFAVQEIIDIHSCNRFPVIVDTLRS